ncbi:MAG: hypothetical protein Q8R53_01535 [Nanoarchaeota archaeon]|nr:hypothetical protein [Nanoarchaeota archaeon]
MGIPRPLLRLRSALTQAGRDLAAVELELKAITELNFGSKKEKVGASVDNFIRNLSQAQQGLPPELINGCNRLSAKVEIIKNLFREITKENYNFVKRRLQEQLVAVREEIRGVTRALGKEMAREAA